MIRLLRWWWLVLFLPSVALAGQLGQGSGSSYPSTLDTKTTFTNKTTCTTSITTRICAETPNDLQDAIVKIETELGLLPKGSYASVVARFNAAAYLTANTFTATQTISNAAPSLVLTDTTASAKSLTIAVDANLANLRESAGASGSLLTLDLANNRVGIGTTSPSSLLHVNGNIVTSNGGIVAINTSDTTRQLTVNNLTVNGTDGWGIYIGGGNDYVDAHGASTFFRGGAGAGENGATRTIMTFNNATGNVGIGTTSPNEGLEMGATLNIRIPKIKSTTGVLFVCVDTNGTFVSQASYCVGT